MKHWLGIDLGGTNIVAAVVNEAYEIVGRGSRKTACPRPADAIIDDMVAACHDACADAGLTLQDMEACGVGSPGAIDPGTGVVAVARNLKFENLPMAQMLKDRTGIDFYVENDANAAAYGEYIAGAGRGTDDFVAVTLGTGVGGGIIVGGKLYSGYDHCGGELGHMVVHVDGELCTCGRKGCWEAYSSATALIRQTKHKMLDHKESLMWKLVDGDIEKVDGRTCFDAAEALDSAAMEVVDYYETYLAAGLTDLVNILRPQRICLGGGIANQKEKLVIPVRKKMKPIIFMQDEFTEILPAALGNDAGLIGAAFLWQLHQ